MPKQLQGSNFGARYLIAAILALSFAGPIVARAGAQSEYQVKAAFLLNFAKFVTWPAAAFRNGESPITICLIGEDPFGKSIDAMIKGQALGGRPFAVRRLAQVPRDESCQIAFFNLGEKNRLAQALTGIKNLPILTVADSDELREAGSMIAFLIEDNKIRFNVNIEAAERAGIKISSQLLKRAKHLYEGKKN